MAYHNSEQEFVVKNGLKELMLTEENVGACCTQGSSEKFPDLTTCKCNTINLLCVNLMCIVHARDETRLTRTTTASTQAFFSILGTEISGSVQDLA